MYTLASYYPMQRIFIDAIGPINVDSQVEFKHIFVIIDAFSRYVRLFPIKSINSDEVFYIIHYTNTKETNSKKVKVHKYLLLLMFVSHLKVVTPSSYFRSTH